MLKRFIPMALSAALIVSAGSAAFAAENSASIKEHRHGTEHHDRILAQCQKDFGTDEAKVKECVAKKGGMQNKTDSTSQ